MGRIQNIFNSSSYVWRGLAFLLGSRITPTITSTDEDVYIDIFFAGYETRRLDPIAQSMLSWEQLAELQLFVYLQHETGESAALGCEAIHNHLTVIFRCWIGNIISRAMLRHESARTIAFRLSVRDFPQILPIIDDIFFVIPLHSGAVGLAGPENLSLKSLVGRDKPFHLTLCVARIAPNGIPVLGQFIDHHQHVGIDHVVLGFDVDIAGSNVVENFKNQRKKQFLDGRLAAMVVPTPLFNSILGGEHFIQACLYHAKSISKYLGVWDLDEFWLLNKTNAPGALTNLVDSYGLYTENGIRSDWASIVLPSYNVLPQPLSQKPRSGVLALDFPCRSTVMDDTRLKSISKVRNIFSHNSHYALSALRNGTRDVPGHPLRPYLAEGPLMQSIGEFGSIHHYISMFTERYFQASDLTLDELKIAYNQSLSLQVLATEPCSL